MNRSHEFACASWASAFLRLILSCDGTGADATGGRAVRSASSDRDLSDHERVATVFFFQAEDGIRDIGVTGVQTCALRIYLQHGAGVRRLLAGLLEQARQLQAHAAAAHRPAPRASPAWRCRAAGASRAEGRSEERRVGKECRSRWSAYHLKKRKEHIRIAPH